VGIENTCQANHGKKRVNKNEGKLQELCAYPGHKSSSSLWTKLIDEIGFALFTS
jgi:hypothetical protein